MNPFAATSCRFDFWALRNSAWRTSPGALIDRIDGSSPSHTVEEFRKDGRIDFHVITDHAGMLNRKEFYRGFLAEEDSGDNMITFAGSEGQNYSFERDKYGLICDNTNEVVCINASTYISAGSFREFLDGLERCPYMIGTLAHPHALSFATGGKGDFRLFKNCTPRFRQIVKYVETGDGTDRSGNLANEYMYSVALDNGFKVSTTCSSDSHGPVWGYDRFPGKTIVMAPEKSREAFLDALLENRAYACMSGNVKLRYSVNGHTAPATLPMAKTYKFHLQTSYFNDIPDTKIIKGEVISNGGVTVKELEGDFSDMSFEIFSDTASWFYLRLWDQEGRKTWSVPVFTGRAPYQTHNDDLEPLSKFGVTVLDERTGESASQLMCDDPFKYWKAKETTASVLIDLKKEELISGLGHYARVLYGRFIKQTGIAKENVPFFWAGCTFGYRVSTSTDGENYTVCAEGVLRTVSGEEIIRFQKRMARFIRLEILSTIGSNSHRKGFEEASVVLGELTVYRKLEKTDMRAVLADRIERYGNYFLQRTDPEIF